MAGERTLEGKRGEKAIVMLKRVCKMLDLYNIPYILEAGTLLGVIRENRLLPWDNDLDITIVRDFEKILVRRIWLLFFRGYYVRVYYYKRDTAFFKKGDIRIVKVKHINLLTQQKKDIVLDIFLKKRIDDEYFWTVGLNPPVLKAVPHRFYEEHKRLNFKGYDFLVPDDSEGYLEEHYGKNWRIPVKEWDFRTSDNSVREILN